MFSISTTVSNTCMLWKWKVKGLCYMVIHFTRNVSRSAVSLSAITCTSKDFVHTVRLVKSHTFACVLYFHMIITTQRIRAQNGFDTDLSANYYLATCFILMSCLTYSLSLMMGMMCSYETFVDFQWTTQHYIPEDRCLLYCIYPVVYCVHNSWYGHQYNKYNKETSTLVLAFFYWHRCYYMFKPFGSSDNHTLVIGLCYLVDPYQRCI
jgi:hypothetical protein